MTRSFNFHRKGERSKAQGMVEFALVLPVVLILMLGIIEAGRLLVAYSAVYTASREAVRYGTGNGISESGRMYFQDCTGMRSAATRVGSIGGVRADDVDIRYDHGPLEEPPAFTALDQCDEIANYPNENNIALGDRVIVRVTTEWNPIVPLVNLPPITVSSTTARTVIRDVDVMGTPLPSPTLKKTYTRTPFPPTATNTVPPTATTTDEPTPTEIVLIELPTTTPRPTRSPTSTGSPTATATSTPTPTSTNSPTPVPTPTDLPDDNCPDIIIEGDVSWDPLVEVNKYTVLIKNGWNHPITIKDVVIGWDNVYLTEIIFTNQTVWASADGVRPSAWLWVPTEDYTIAARPNANETTDAELGFTFRGSLADEPNVIIHFNTDLQCSFLPKFEE